MKIKEIKEFSKEEAEAKVKECQSELFNLRLRATTGQMQKPHKIKELRRTIARLLTIITQKSAVAEQVAK